MNDISTLIQLNIELEGLLRVLADRDNTATRALLAQKFRLYSDTLTQYLASPTEQQPGNPTAQQPKSPIEQPGNPTEEQPGSPTAQQPKSLIEQPSSPTAQQPKSLIEQPSSPTEEQPSSPTAQLPKNPTEEPKSLTEQPNSLTAQLPKSLKTAFTLNDKFRFRRELFNSDIEDFEDTIELLAQMPSYDEAVDYLTNDLLWDTQNPAVEEFFEILKKTFATHAR